MRFWFAFILFLFGISLARAEVSYERVSKAVQINVDGRIDSKTLASVRLALQKAAEENPSRIFVGLNSEGGDVVSAMQIGRLIRKARAWIIVPGDSVCASACVLIAAGGTRRFFVGPVIIHRPYASQTSNQSLSDSQETFDRVGDVVKSYLREMNVSATLWDRMVAIPPSEGRAMPKGELDEVLLLGEDPVEEEQVRQKRAKRMGITPEEYVHREALVNKNCNNQGSSFEEFEAYGECRNHYMGWPIQH